MPKLQIVFQVPFQPIYGYAETIKEQTHACICENKGSFTSHMRWTAGCHKTKHINYRIHHSAWKKPLQ